jgi:ribosomal protein S18 acetylase RimI-like enzyme
MEISSGLSGTEQELLRERLEAFNEPIAGPKKFAEFSLGVKDDAGDLVGGVIAQCIWQWVHINVIWVSSDLRGQGLGSRLLRAAEQEAVRRGRRFAVLHTFSFQARPFYERHGYEVSGELKNFPEGHSQFKMFKALAPAGDSSDAS